MSLFCIKYLKSVSYHQFVHGHHPVNCLLSTQSCVNLHNTLQKHLIIWKLQPQIQLSYPDHTNDSFDDWRKLKCSTLLSSPGVLNLLQEFFSFSP